MTPSSNVPISIFTHGKQELQLTGQAPMPGGFAWSAKSDNPDIAAVSVNPVQSPHFPTQYWELEVRGGTMGKTQVHVQESQATNPPNIRHSFTLDVTVLGLLK
jgi:hypothetical protein